MSHDVWVTYAWSALAVAVLVVVTFLSALRAGRHSVIDVTWGLFFVAVAAVTALTGEGDRRTRLVVLAIVGLWGCRLGLHIYLRSRGHGEDPRYAAMLAKAPGNPNAYAFKRVYLTQAVIALVVAAPIVVSGNEREPLGWAVLPGLVLWAIGLIFEAVGDFQLQRFRDDPATTGTVLDTGLWRYTRHPNYFGDACVWWGIYLVASSHWPACITLWSPVIMTVLLTRVSGKPLLEKGMSERRPGYDDYVRRTSGFLPRPPKRA